MPNNMQVDLLCQSASVDALRPFQALFVDCEALLMSDDTPRFIIKSLYHQAAWAAGVHGTRVLRHLWSRPLRWRMTPVAFQMSRVHIALIDLFDVALRSLDAAWASSSEGWPMGEAASVGVDGVGGRRRLMDDVVWLIQAVSWTAGPVTAWERVWYAAPSVARACVANARALSIRRAHIVAGVHTGADLALVDAVFSVHCVDAAIGLYSTRMLARLTSGHAIATRVQDVVRAATTKRPFVVSPPIHSFLA
jgi:hypothetical protein